MAQWIRRVTTNHEIGGSNPSGDACENGLVGYDDCLTRSRSRVRSSVLVEAMAQWQRVGFQTRRLGVRLPLASCLLVLLVLSLISDHDKCPEHHQQSEVAQWKRVGLITQRSEDRNLASLALLAQLAARRSHHPTVVS